MKNILIFGAGSTGERCFNIVRNNKEVKVVGFLDNDLQKKGKLFNGVEIIGDASCLIEADINYDEIVVASLSGYAVIRDQLVNLGVPQNKINTSTIATMVQARINFLKCYAETCGDLVTMDTTQLCCAEGGVYQGEFAKLINSYFPHNRLYLFDTFEGFSETDLKNETDRKEFYKEKHQSNTSVDLVLSKMLYKDNVIIKKGFFPDTTKDLPEEKYLFVNLDFDLYDPTLAGLKYFYSKMVAGGVILIHDYYNVGYPGVKRAVKEFCELNKEVMFIPIGDECSIAIMKTVKY